MVKNDSTVRVSITGPIEEQNYYLYRVEVLKDGVLISDDTGVGSDRIINEDTEKFLDISPVNNGETVRVSLHNIDFSTFQFYFNVHSNQVDEPGASSLFLPINIVGNITNITTNKLILGNFGIAGFSTMTMDF